MPTSIDEFITTLTLEECAARLKTLPAKYFSLELTVYVVHLNDNKYHFEIFAKGYRNWMNMRLFGFLKSETSDSTQVSIEDITPGTLGYLAQYLWVVSPLFLILALLSGNPYVLLIIPGAVVFSLVTLVSKQQDKDEMLRIIHRVLDVT